MMARSASAMMKSRHFHLSRGLAAIFILIAWCGHRLPLFAQPAEEIQWTHHLTFPDSEGVRSVAFSPDGTSALVHLHERAIDVWQLIVFYWPEVLGSLNAALTLALIVWIIRVATRPQSTGAPYCRKCNYDLTSHVTVNVNGERTPFTFDAAARCPECGVLLTRHHPRRGRRGMRRVFPLACVWLAVLAVFIPPMAMKAPRHNAVSNWFRWPSLRLAKLAQQQDWKWLANSVRIGDRVRVIDPRTGATIRIFSWSPTPSYAAIAAAPDGKTFFLTGPGHDQVSQYDMDNGKLLASVQTAGHSTLGPKGQTIVAFSQDASVAYVQWLDRDAALCGVSAWNLRTHQLKTLVQTPAYVDPRTGGKASMGRQFLLRGKHDPPQFVSWPDFLEAYTTKSFVLRLHSAGSRDAAEIDPRIAAEIDPRPLPDASSIPVLNPKGDRLLVPERFGASLLMVDLTGEHPTTRIQPLRTHVGTHQAISRDGRLLAIEATTGAGAGIALRHMPSSRWIATLALPKGLYAPQPAFSQDGHWLAAVCQRSVNVPGPNIPGGRGGFTHELVVWNLSHLHASSPELEASNGAD